MLFHLCSMKLCQGWIKTRIKSFSCRPTIWRKGRPCHFSYTAPFHSVLLLRAVYVLCQLIHRLYGKGKLSFHNKCMYVCWSNIFKNCTFRPTKLYRAHFVLGIFFCERDRYSVPVSTSERLVTLVCFNFWKATDPVTVCSVAGLTCRKTKWFCESIVLRIT
jgi:hypothetical protein